MASVTAGITALRVETFFALQLYENAYQHLRWTCNTGGIGYSSGRLRDTRVCLLGHLFVLPRASFF